MLDPSDDNPRNIPAYAGKTGGNDIDRRFWEEHPRIRGENSATMSATPCKIGTSPHTRGKRDYSAGVASVGWNIPAYAGKAIPFLAGSVKEREHPRIRGENQLVQLFTGGIQGTSPHTRGKRNGHSAVTPVVRNIPAYAGKTRTQSTRTPSTREHPRIRGENPLLEGPIRHQPGTSPHTRGKPRQQQLGSVSARNIPAYAGKTYSIPARLITSKEHPRIRGENK